MEFFNELEGNRRDRAAQLETYTNRLFGLCLAVVVLGLAILIVAPLQRSSFGAAISSGAVALLSALMCFAVGAFLGLLFGVPRYKKEDDKDNSIEPNNNLEQVSDWLTKMIVGITLVQFGTIVQKVKVVARQINDAMLGCPPQCADNYAMGLAVIGFFTVSGFLMMYLWARIYLLLDVNMIRGHIARGEAALKELEKSGVTVQPEREAPSAGFFQKLVGTAVLIDDSVSKPQIDAEVKPGPHANDPWKGAFGGKSRDKGREVTAEVKPVPRSEYCAVQLTVRSTEATKPLDGNVKFFLHDTFPEPVKTVSVQNGVATLAVASWGAFTVGVLADNGETKLELDLSSVPNAPEDWRGR